MKEIFKRLVDRVGYLDVYKALKAGYDLTHDTIVAHLNVLYQWKGMEPVLNDKVIIVSRHTDPEDGDYWHVNCEIPNSEHDSWAIDFTPWAEWLGMSYRIPKGMDEVEFVAHCLYEATFYGFKESDIANIYEEVCNNVDEVIAELKPYEKPLDIQSVLR